MNFAAVEKIAAAILYEGYILYPYRPTAIKNRQRWNFGTLYPRVYAEAQRPQEPYHFIAECLVELGAEDATLDLKFQSLQLTRTRSNSTLGIEDSLHALSDPSLSWEEAVERNFELENLSLSEMVERPIELKVQPTDPLVPAALSIHPPARLDAKLTVSVALLQGGIRKVRLVVENVTSLASGTDAKREDALPHSFVSAHMLLGIRGGRFVSLLDPPEICREAAAACSNVGVFPVLAGPEPDRTMMLCSPIILYDYPEIAPESEGDFFDGTEMDEMLTLRVLTLSDSEKEAMRNGDPRARKILERTESLTCESMMKAHGAIRGMRDIEEGA